MSAERLREAAALMRSRAEAAVLSPWQAVEGASGQWWVEHPNTADIAVDLHGENAQHIASWHPAMALEVAAFLDFAAAYGDQPEPQSPTVQFALSIANAYLGAQS